MQTGLVRTSSKTSRIYGLQSLFYLAEETEKVLFPNCFFDGNIVFLLVEI